MFYWLTSGGLNAPKGFNGPDQPHLGPPPTPLPMGPGASFVSRRLFSPCLSYVLGVSVLAHGPRWSDRELGWLPSSACGYGPDWWFPAWPWPADCLPALMLDLPCHCKLAWYLDFCLTPAASPEPSLLLCSGIVGPGPGWWGLCHAGCSIMFGSFGRSQPLLYSDHLCFMLPFLFLKSESVTFL